MSTFHTNLKVSQKIASLGVKAESEKYWIKRWNGEYYWAFVHIIEFTEKEIEDSESYHSYLLSELFDVLRELEVIKKDIFDYSSPEYEFCKVCEIFCKEGESAANKYLEEII